MLAPGATASLTISSFSDWLHMRRVETTVKLPVDPSGDPCPDIGTDLSLSQTSSRHKNSLSSSSARRSPPDGYFPFIKHVFADGGYSGDKLATDLASQRVSLEIVKRTDNEGGFKLIRRRWVIERTFSWLRRNRRLMVHYEAIAIIAEGFAKLAMISVMLKRLTEPTPGPKT